LFWVIETKTLIHVLKNFHFFGFGEEAPPFFLICATGGHVLLAYYTVMMKNDISGSRKSLFPTDLRAM
jgi:hypothetical protein